MFSLLVKPKQRSRWLAICVAFALTLMGSCFSCGGSSAATPSDALKSLAEAIRSEDYERAYELMSSQYRQTVTYEHFRQRLQARRPHALATADHLDEALRGAAQAVHLKLDDGNEIELVYDDNAWLLAHNVADYYDRSTPQAALNSFIRAIHNRRYDVLIELMPKADREGITPARLRQTWDESTQAEADRLALRLKQSSKKPIEITGRRATLVSDHGATVQFYKESDGWTIENPE